MRNIRRKNEQVFLSPVPRGYSLYRVSASGKLHGLSLPTRRDLRFMPYVSGSVNDDRTLRTNEVDRTGRLGIDVKWGVRADLTLDATVNTDFAQVEADEEQVNLTRFALVFPEKRPFFLENAQLFQVGQPQGVDLFFSRRIGWSDRAADRHPRRRAPERQAGWRLQRRAAEPSDRPGLRPSDRRSLWQLPTTLRWYACSARLAAPTSAGSSSTARAPGVWRRPTTSIVLVRPRWAWQTSANGRLFAFVARTDSPASKGGSDYAGRVYYNYAGPVWSTAAGYSQVGDRFNPEVGFRSAAPTGVWKAATASRTNPNAGRLFVAWCPR